jgi:NADH dehydrogenase [ubiquinone] 1 alpha subcomplex assembly factor 7
MPSEQNAIRLDQFMNDALKRYYHNHDPFGVDGDFTTAPEISQLFGEIIGIWVVQQWMLIHKPQSFNLIEIGPGRGTLMADLLRGTKHIPLFHDAMNIHLIETSPILIKKQQGLLHDYNVRWHKNLNNLRSDEINIFIANEFFDALPIRQFKKTKIGWSEHYVYNDESVWLAYEGSQLKKTLPPETVGDIYEYSDFQELYARTINDLCTAALIIDYGYNNSAYGESLQALYRHKYCNFTHHIGDADITSHIDFEWLSSFFEKKNTNLLTQADFLAQNGIHERFEILKNDSLKSGYKRLTHDMGVLFKVLEVSPNL